MVMSRFRGRRSFFLYCIVFNLLTCCYSMNLDMTIENNLWNQCGISVESTIGRWIKDQLKEAGIDTSIFSAHSTREAAGSKALANGVPLKSILNQGHWARESTFAKFYQRDVNVDRNVVGQSVLQISDSEE